MTVIAPADVLASRRPFEVPVARFQVLGERCSGTNFADFLIGANTRLQRTRDYGWKHGFPGFHSVLRDDLLIVCFRDAESWLRSMYQKPWHVPDEDTDVTFSEFLRSPWRTILDMPIAMSAIGGRKSFRLPVQRDRHPITGKMPANPVDLRNLKNAAFLGILERGCNVALIRHEDVTARPDAVLDRLCALFAIERNPGALALPDTQLGEMTTRTIEGPRRDATPVFSDADRAFVHDALDHDTETRLGYRFAA